MDLYSLFLFLTNLHSTLRSQIFALALISLFPSFFLNQLDFNLLFCQKGSIYPFLHILKFFPVLFSFAVIVLDFLHLFSHLSLNSFVLFLCLCELFRTIAILTLVEKIYWIFQGLAVTSLQNCQLLGFLNVPIHQLFLTADVKVFSFFSFLCISKEFMNDFPVRLNLLQILQLPYCFKIAPQVLCALLLINSLSLICSSPILMRIFPNLFTLIFDADILLKNRLQKVRIFSVYFDYCSNLISLSTLTNNGVLLALLRFERVKSRNYSFIMLRVPDECTVGCESGLKLLRSPFPLWSHYFINNYNKYRNTTNLKRVSIFNYSKIFNAKRSWTK